MKFLKKRNLRMLLGGATAGFIGLLATLAFLHTPRAWASPGYDMDCTLCHSVSSAITISTDLTSPHTVAPGTSFNVNLSWSGGGSYTEVTWPNVVDNAKFVTATPLIAYSGSKASGTATSTLKAPATAGTYTVRVYASTLTSGRITNYSNVTIIVSAQPTTYTITASAGSNGSISPSGAVSVNSGSNQSFAITAATGYHVATVLVDGASVGAMSNYTFNSVTNTHTISATFAINTYTLAYTAGANGTITGTASQTVNYNGSGTAVTAVANTGYHFVNWSDSSTQNPRTDASVTANKSVTANFAINTYTLNYAAGANGTLTGTASQTVNYNSSGTAVTAVPNTGYHFVNWSDGKTANPRTDAAVTANVAVTANFAADAVTNYTLTYIAGPNGSIYGTASQTVASGATGTAVTAVPNTGYHFVNWSDGKTANPRTDTSVTANVAVTANFAINTYTLAYTAGANGTLTGTVSQTVNYNANGTAVTAVPNTSYHFVNWSDGKTANPRTDSNVTTNVNVTASFAADNVVTYTIGVAANPATGGSVSGGGTVNSGASVTVTATANPGYTFSSWTENGARVSTSASYTFTAGSSRNLIANFAVETHTITVTSGANGTITPGTEIVNHAATATFTITSNTGYHIASVVVDGSPLLTALSAPTTASTTYTFASVTSNHSISATFAADASATDSVGPVAINLKISPKITKRNNPTQVTLTALVDDSATGNSSVTGAEYWIDAGPHVAMTASVNAFTSPTVQVNATITLAGLTPGRHILYVRGQDSANNWGPSARIGFRVIASSSPSASAVQFKATAESSDDDWNEYTGDTADEIEIDENSKGDVIQIVDHLTNGQNVILWPNGSSEYTDSH